MTSDPFERILREAMAADRMAKQMEAQAQVAREAELRQRYQMVDRSDPVDANAFQLHDQLSTAEFLGGINNIRFEGNGTILPVQGVGEFTHSETTSSPAAELWAPPHTSEEYFTNFFRLAGYVLVSPLKLVKAYNVYNQPIQYTSGKILYTGFIGEGRRASRFDEFIFVAWSYGGDSYPQDGITIVQKSIPSPAGWGGGYHDYLRFYSLPAVSAVLTDPSQMDRAKQAFQEKLADLVTRKSSDSIGWM